MPEQEQKPSDEAIALPSDNFKPTPLVNQEFENKMRAVDPAKFDSIRPRLAKATEEAQSMSEWWKAVAGIVEPVLGVFLPGK